MSDEHAVRGPEPDVRRHGAEAADGDLDRALGSLTDVSPSPALRANVMRRIADERKATIRLRGPASLRLRSGQVAGFGVRLRAAAVAVLLIAVAVAWFSLRREPARQTVQQQPPSHDIVLPEQPGTSAGEARIGTRPQLHQRPSAVRVAARIPTSTPAREVSLEPVDELPEPGALVVQPIGVDPLPDSQPVTMTPMAFKPIDIPALEIRPIDEPPGEASRPSKQDPDKKRPGDTIPGATR